MQFLDQIVPPRFRVELRKMRQMLQHAFHKNSDGSALLVTQLWKPHAEPQLSSSGDGTSSDRVVAAARGQEIHFGPATRMH
jgi:hypothetical protein